MTADLSDGCGNGNGWLVHGMPVSRNARQLASDVVEPAIPAETVTLPCRFHCTSVYCKHRAKVEIGSFSRQHTLKPQDAALCVKTHVVRRSPGVGITTAPPPRKTRYERR
jgi:hypothetical protein